MPATAYNGFLDALEAALSVRAGLAGVRVFTAPVAPEDAGEEAIVLAPETDIEQTIASMSSTDYSESFEVPGLILCYHAMTPGATTVATINAAAKVVRDRACAILKEIIDQLASDMTVSGSVLGANTATLKVQQGLAPEGQLGRVCQIEFTIHAEAHTTP